MISTRQWTSFVIAFALGAATVPTSVAAATAPAHAQQTLPRRGFFGVTVIDSQGGVAVRTVFPGSTADVLGVLPGDVIFELDGEPVGTVAGFVAGVAARRAGEPIRVAVRRGGEVLHVSGPSVEYPREVIDDVVVDYGSVQTDRGDQLRTIVTRPADAQNRRPALFFIQGLGCSSIDKPFATASDTDVNLIHEIARAGYVTMRVEKSGLGDSRGRPCSAIDLHDELDGYRKGLSALSGLPFVDPSQVVLMGHSMGGVMAPLLADETELAGVAVYGTILKSFFEYMVLNIRRQMPRDGAMQTREDRELAASRAHKFWSRVLFDDLAPGTAVAQSPDLRPSLDAIGDSLTLYGRHYSFFRQLQALDLGSYWSRIGTSVLALHGEFDWISDPDDHREIAQLASASPGGSGEYLELGGLDHVLTWHASLDDSFWDYPNGIPSSAVARTLLAWMERVAPFHEDPG
jgi:pimeloyl-ACP methyl ester carboxylesterase